jgi:Zn-dependent protease with chaperone function
MAMNFFEQQDHARRQTRKLIILFVLSLAVIVLAVNAGMALVWVWTQGAHFDGQYGYPRGFFITNTLVTVGLIGGGTLIETWNLRDGGDAVAKMAGGRLVAPGSRDPKERRLLNVVEEMALASGVACPKVYVLDREESINAFAAGYNPNEAVVAVTRGTLNRLTRDELQGVIGHEFSHILNGDMRLNVRLIGVLFGLQMIAGLGQHLIDFGRHFSGSRSRDRGDKGPSAQAIIFASGVALLVIGYIGVFFGRLIKAAVSRQREFLADASAVQFTRNPDGIGSALRKIGGLSRSMTLGSRIDHPNAELLSHLFLGPVKTSLMSGLLATHPPVAERVRRIYGRSAELLDAPELREEAPEGETLPDLPYVAVASGSAAEAQVRIAPPGIAFGAAVAGQLALAPQLDNAVREPYAACAVVYALLLDADSGRAAQTAVLDADAPQQKALAAYLADTIAAMPRSARLPLLDLAMPALLALPQPARARLLATCDRLIGADRRVTLAEFVLRTVLERRLAPHAGRAIPVRYHDLQALRDECATLLSLVAHVAAPQRALTPAAAFMQAAARHPQPALRASDLRDVPALGFAEVQRALLRIGELAPLAKPALIKLLLAGAGDAEPMPVECADLLRAICAAIEVPVPAAVAATYTAHAWALG